MSVQEERGFTKIVAVIAIIIITVAIYFIMTSTIQDKPLAGRGGEIDRKGDADIGGDFTLIDQDGKTFTNTQLKGKLSLIYFGFTFCPDICPTSLQKITKVIETLDKYGKDVTPVFITIDPKRDTSESLKKYLANFHPKLIGLTGEEKDIKDTADKFKVFYAPAPGSGTGRNDYLLDHTSLVYIMDKNGKYMKHFHIDSSPEEIIEYIRVNG
ncbi:MAG: SCO family protein [Pseudomonadota bacterium]